ncbi:Tn3 family transposase [Streptomyces lydicus]|uniref:Tn3 family transposase n=1 Tax=Streptomyces lydicus TaxID=47763 RepID=UPI0037D7F5D2
MQGPCDVLVGYPLENRLGDTPGRPPILKEFGRYSQRPTGGTDGPRRSACQVRIRGALGLVLNALVLFNTRYMDAAVAQLRADGHEVRDEDVARLSPFVRHHVNMLGRYSFQLPDLPGGLRPPREMNAIDNE